MMSKPTETASNGMSCNEVCDLLYLYVSHELEPEELETVRQHLASCVNCRQALKEHTKLLGLLDEHLADIGPSVYSEGN